ncbi:LacI family DNA-binding transcriptional regulator [Actinokineospora soli]|uniref:LacI family DNA-binding transcriptional regulator n=1 Tax=Actinokineospora soli TaxID=1048753 RepID=A0ABW2TPN2_9PSEU
MSATIRQVALAAGVSAATVSRALSGSPLVDPRTREAVLRTAADLDYVPNRAARGLITGRTGNLALVVPDLTDPGVPPVVKAALARARDANYAVFLVDTDDRPDAELAAVRSLAKQVDGVVLCAPRMSADDLRAAASCTTASSCTAVPTTSPR